MTCATCEIARANAKAAGHRDWREGVCFDHAGVDLNGEWWRALLAERDIAEESEQPDLFGAAA